MNEQEKQAVETLTRSFTKMETLYKVKCTEIEAKEEEISRLKSENAALRERLENAVELPAWQKNGEAISLFYRNKDNDICTELYWEDVYYDGVRGDKYAKTRFAEILKMESDL